MRTLCDRQSDLRNKAIQARRRNAERATKTNQVPEAANGAARDERNALWVGGPFVVALLFAQPDSASIRTLDARGAYFDCRTGDTWDLFFPGYHQSPRQDFEMHVGGRPVGRDFTSDWYFNPNDFDLFRSHVEHDSGGRWRYSGGTDLVLVNGYMPEAEPITVDWESTMTGSLTEPDGTHTLTIAQVVERLTRDLEGDDEDAAYGVGAVVSPDVPKADRNAARDITVGALGGIAAALGKGGLGL